MTGKTLNQRFGNNTTKMQNKTKEELSVLAKETDSIDLS
jgi:hypothetical protein